MKIIIFGNRKETRPKAKGMLALPLSQVCRIQMGGKLMVLIFLIHR
jgi:hypothetical protein